MKTLPAVLEELEQHFTRSMPELPAMSGARACVTGAGGSIGSSLCLQLIKQGVTSLLLIDSNEYALYSIHRELKLHGVEATPVLCSYGDREILQEVLLEFKPSIVFHAGAYKHVPMCERNWKSAYKNNVIEAQAFFEVCKVVRVPTVVVISSDKAVNPTSFMGVTKLLVEHLALEILSKDVVKIVRFGNVLGSSGSVIPLFYSQMIKGGYVTLTHRDMTRYFMTLQQASYLVLKCCTLPGERFLLNMGEPVKIMQIAQTVAEIMGVEFKYQEIGLRPGEKMYEELTLDPNAVLSSDGNIFTVCEPDINIWPLLDRIRLSACYDSVKEVLQGSELNWQPSTKPEVAPLTYQKDVEDCFYVNQ